MRKLIQIIVVSFFILNLQAQAYISQFTYDEPNDFLIAIEITFTSTSNGITLETPKGAELLYETSTTFSPGDIITIISSNADAAFDSFRSREFIQEPKLVNVDNKSKRGLVLQSGTGSSASNLEFLGETSNSGNISGFNNYTSTPSSGIYYRINSTLQSTGTNENNFSTYYGNLDGNGVTPGNSPSNTSLTSLEGYSNISESGSTINLSGDDVTIESLTVSNTSVLNVGLSDGTDNSTQTISSLTVDAGGTVNIYPNAKLLTTTLTNNGTVNVISSYTTGVSDTDGIDWGQFSTDTYAGSTNLNVQTIINASTPSLWSPSVSGQTLKDFYDANASILSTISSGVSFNSGTYNIIGFAKWDIDTGGWALYYQDTVGDNDLMVSNNNSSSNASSLSLSLGDGYFVQTSSSGAVTASGTPSSSSDLTKTINYGGTWSPSSKWQLIGNPFTCYIPINQGALTYLNSNGITGKSAFLPNGSSGNTALLQSTRAAYYFYDGSTYNSISASDASSNSYFLPPGQAFWVASAGGSQGQSFTFTSAMKTSLPTSSPTNKDPSRVSFGAQTPSQESIGNFVELIFENQNLTKKISFSFKNDHQYSNGLDPYIDTYSYNNTSSFASLLPEPLHTQNNNHLDYQGLHINAPNESLKIPLHLSIESGSSYHKLRVGQFVNNSNPFNVYLHDNTDNTLVIIEDEYIFDSNLTYTGSDRFSIVFSSNALSNEQLNYGDFHVSYSRKDSNISIFNINPFDKVQAIQIFDISGKRIYTLDHNQFQYRGNTLKTTPLNLKGKNAYLLMINSNLNSTIKKIIL